MVATPDGFIPHIYREGQIGGTPAPRNSRAGPQIEGSRGTGLDNLCALTDMLSAMSSSRRRRIAVTADHPLVAEAIEAALVDRGLDVVEVAWPTNRKPGKGRPMQLSLEQAADPAAGLEAGLMVIDVNRVDRLHDAITTMRAKIPWVVLVDAEAAPVWHSLYGHGAAAVVPTTSTLDEVESLLNKAATGEILVAEEQLPHGVGARRRVSRRRAEAEKKMSKMTPREHEVLTLLWTGESVRTIATRLRVGEATVRSQVKTVLRKLDVNSQLAAVAVLNATHAPSQPRISARS